MINCDIQVQQLDGAHKLLVLHKSSLVSK